MSDSAFLDWQHNPDVDWKYVEIELARATAALSRAANATVPPISTLSDAIGGLADAAGALEAMVRSMREAAA